MRKAHMPLGPVVGAPHHANSRVTRDATALEHWMLGVVATLSCAPAGCAGSSNNSIEHNPGFVRPACPTGSVHQWLQGMTLPAGTDYVKLQEDGTAPLELGVACATAPDMAACSAALASAPAPMVAGTPFGFCGDVCPRANLIATRGGSIIVASTLDQIRQALLPIDDSAKAMLLASLSGLDVSCAEGGVAPTSGGWTVMGLTYQGCDGKTRHVLKISTDGTVSGVSSEVVHTASSNCVVGRRVLPGYMAMGSTGMGDMMDVGRPKNTLPMMAGTGPFGDIEMGGMFTILKVREGITSYDDPPWYKQPPGSVATKVSG
jgi:hypothetical protein